MKYRLSTVDGSPPTPRSEKTSLRGTLMAYFQELTLTKLLESKENKEYYLIQFIFDKEEGATSPGIQTSVEEIVGKVLQGDRVTSLTFREYSGRLFTIEELGNDSEVNNENN